MSRGPNTSVFLSWCVLVGVTRTQKPLPQMSLKTLERANCGEFETQIETPQEYYAHLKTIWIGSRLSPGRMWREREAIRQLGLDQKERPRLLCKMKKVGSWGGGFLWCLVSVLPSGQFSLWCQRKVTRSSRPFTCTIGRSVSYLGKWAS